MRACSDHYRREVKNRLFALWREQGLDGAASVPPEAVVSAPAGRSGPTPVPSSYGFATVITLALVNHPWLLDRFAEEVVGSRHQGQEAGRAAADGDPHHLRGRGT